MPYTPVTTLQQPSTSFLNTNFVDQVVSTVNSAAKPTGTEGQAIAVTNQDRLEMYDGAAWRRLAWYSPSGRTGFQVSRGAALSIPTGTGTFTAITWDAETTDTDGFIAAPSATATVPAGLGGLYGGACYINWVSSPGANSSIELLLNGAVAYRQAIGAGTQMTGCSFSFGPVAVSAAQTIQIRLSQGSGAAINITGGFQMWRMAL